MSAEYDEVRQIPDSKRPKASVNVILDMGTHTMKKNISYKLKHAAYLSVMHGVNWCNVIS